MKKIIVLLSLVAMMFTVSPIGVSASDSMYNVDIEFVPDSKGENWHTSSDGKGKYIVKKFSVGKTNEAGYVYIHILEVVNVKIRSVVAGDAFDIVGDYVSDDKGRIYVLKTKSGKALNTKTELLTVVADIVNPNDPQKNCDLSYSPLSTKCSNENGKYFDDKGKLVTEDEYKAACEGTTPVDPGNPDDEPNNPNKPDNPQTGSVIPYVAIAGGLAAIAGVYFVSKKSNKIYKI